VTRPQAWLAATRPRTLSAAVVPVAVGTAAAARAGAAEWPLALGALSCALLLQVGTNLVNDWGDARRGADGQDRLGPQRAVQSGWLTPEQVLCGAVVAFAAAALVGLWLVLRGGWVIAGIGIGGLLAAVAYTAGPFPLAYHALGEVFVFLFFGPLAVCGTELLQAGRATWPGLAAAVPVGCLAVAILLVNNVRDVDTDRRAGKRTLVVRLGRSAGRGLYAAMLSVAAIAVVWLAARLDTLGPLLALAAVPLMRAPLTAVLACSDGPALNAALGATARVHLLFGLLLAVGLTW
jgi:1,4-dihydroxy-2-naphthoate octaprenyltransferase